MRAMSLTEMNRHIAQRHSQGTPHNIGIKAKSTLEAVGQELKENPPKILAKTRRKFGKKKAEAQRKAILLDKARRAGARIPQQ